MVSSTNELLVVVLVHLEHILYTPSKECPPVLSVGIAYTYTLKLSEIKGILALTKI